MASANALQDARSAQMSDGEQRARLELAATYRLAAHYGWGNLIFNHIAMRVPGEPYFLVKPNNVTFSEVRASQLAKLRLDGARMDESPKINPAAFTIHTAVLNARPEINCTIHVHTAAGMAMSAHRRGLLPLNQGAMRFYNRLSYHDHEGISDDLNEAERIARDLGPQNKALILRNHGLLTAGDTACEALDLMRGLVLSCETQLMLEASGVEIVIPPPEVCERTARQIEQYQKSVETDEWPAYLRLIDAIDVSYRT